MLTCCSPAPVSQQARRSPAVRPIYSDSESDDEWAGVANKLTGPSLLSYKATQSQSPAARRVQVQSPSLARWDDKQSPVGTGGYCSPRQGWILLATSQDGCCSGRVIG